MGGLIFGWPQYVWLAMALLGLGTYLAKHGEPRNDPYNFGVALLATLINGCILYAGGFFN